MVIECRRHELIWVRSVRVPLCPDLSLDAFLPNFQMNVGGHKTSYRNEIEGDHRDLGTYYVLHFTPRILGQFGKPSRGPCHYNPDRRDITPTLNNCWLR